MQNSLSKKLALGFFLILLVSFIIAGGVGVYMFNNMIQSDLQRDVVHDLDAADVIYQNHLERIEDSVVYTSSFSRICDPLIDDDPELLRQNLVEIYNDKFRYRLDILTVTDKNGVVIARARNPGVYGDSKIDNNLIWYALNGATISSTEIMTHEELLKEDRMLADLAYMEFTDTPRAKPRPESFSDSGMVLIVATPIYDNYGNVIGVLYGADLINRDYKIVDKVKNALYKDETYGGRDMGTATIFQEDFRISTNVPTDTGERAITTRVSQEVNEAVLERGEYWKDRAFVVNAWYVTAYKPIANFDGGIIGILYVGILEKPYKDAGYRILIAYFAFLFSGFILSLFISRYYAGTITRPINKLIKGTEAIAKGEFETIYVGTRDEIEQLADAFNDMAMNLQKTMGELVSSKKEIETIFESISDVASAQGMDMKIMFANRPAKELYGGDIVGKFCYQIYEGKDQVCDDCPAIESLHTGNVKRVVHCHVDDNGNPSYHEVTGSPLKDENDITIGILAIRRDVTEQKMLENELRESYRNLKDAYEELQQMDRMKSELVANISHELRTPLTSIKGYTELMQDGMLGDVTDMQTKSLGVMLRNVERLTRLITNILDLSRFEYMEHEVSIVKLNHVIEDVVADFSKEAMDSGISIKTEIEDNLTLDADEDRLIQVFANLMENALKFTDSGGTVTIKAYMENNYNIHIEVSDTGIGIAEDKLERIFDRFYQVDSSSTRKFGGTGLGLAICKKIIERHNGTIWAQSTLGEGSVFHIILSIVQPESNK